MSQWNKLVRNRRHDALSRVDWRDFERMLADHYRRQGYKVEHCGTGASASRFDGGIDLKLFRDDAYLVVQCKHWNARQVTHNAMHELAGIMLTEGATGAILVTSGEFTPHARASAAKLGNMQLIDGDALRGMLGYVPEPAAGSGLIDDRAVRIMTEVGNRVAYAAEKRIRYGVQRTSRSAVATFVWIPLAKLGLFLLLVWGGMTVVSNAIRGLAPPARVQAAAPREALPPPPVVAPALPAPTPPTVTGVVYATPPPPLSEAEIREQQRLADEAMRVLAPNTPEMDMGYPDDPRANRYKAPTVDPDRSAGWGRQ